MSIIALIRHGETDWNLEHRIQGVSDIPLNQTGLDQALRLSQLVTSSKYPTWDRLFSSPLIRAKQTLAPTAELLELEIGELAAFRERNYGKGEGLVWKEVHELYGDDVPGREEVGEVRGRALPALITLAHELDGKNAMVISHGGTIRAVLQTLTRGIFPPSGVPIPNIGINLVYHEDNHFWLEGHDPVDREYLEQVVHEESRV